MIAEGKKLFKGIYLQDDFSHQGRKNLIQKAIHQIDMCRHEVATRASRAEAFNQGLDKGIEILLGMANNQ